MDIQGLNIEEISNVVDGVINRFEWGKKVVKIGVFGSFARNEVGYNSDLDLLINYTPNKKCSDAELLELIKQQIAFESGLSKAFSPIELSIVDSEALDYEENKLIKDGIYRDVIWFYEQK